MQDRVVVILVIQFYTFTFYLNVILKLQISFPIIR